MELAAWQRVVSRERGRKGRSMMALVGEFWRALSSCRRTPVHVLLFMYSTVSCRLEPEAAESDQAAFQCGCGCIAFHAPPGRVWSLLLKSARMMHIDRPLLITPCHRPNFGSLSDYVKSINIGIGTSHIYRISSCPYTFVCWRFPHFRRWRKREVFFSSWEFSLQNTFQTLFLLSLQKHHVFVAFFLLLPKA